MSRFAAPSGRFLFAPFSHSSRARLAVNWMGGSLLGLLVMTACGTDQRGGVSSTADGTAGDPSSGPGGSEGQGGASGGGESGPSTCEDIPPDDRYSCVEQVGWDKCSVDFMADSCNVSCGRCPPPDGRVGGEADDLGIVARTDCGAEPVNSQATPEARRLLCYVHDLSGKGVLSGQQETSWNPNPRADVEFYKNFFGVYPAVLGGDYLYPQGTSDRAFAWWLSGGIVLLRYHMGAPPDEDSYESSLTSTDMEATLTPGTVEHDSLVAKLDYASDELTLLQEAGVAVLWAPYHEFQGSGWFWWAKGTSEQFHRLWEFTYEYMTETRGLDNLIWIAPSSHNPSSVWFPDPAFYDLGGPDTYQRNAPFAALYRAAEFTLGDSPIVLHETGTAPDPDTMFPDQAPWVLWNVWAGYYAEDRYNTLDSLREAYSSQYTITRDEIPDLR